MDKEAMGIENVEKESQEEVELIDCVNHIKIKPMINIDITIEGLETVQPINE